MISSALNLPYHRTFFPLPIAQAHAHLLQLSTVTISHTVMHTT